MQILWTCFRGRWSNQNRARRPGSRRARNRMQAQQEEPGRGAAPPLSPPSTPINLCSQDAPRPALEAAAAPPKTAPEAEEAGASSSAPQAMQRTFFVFGIACIEWTIAHRRAARVSRGRSGTESARMEDVPTVGGSICTNWWEPPVRQTGAFQNSGCALNKSWLQKLAAHSSKSNGGSAFSQSWLRN